MQLSKYVTFLTALAILLPASAMAKSDNTRKVQLSTAVQVGSTQLQPGTYRVQWQGNGPAVNVEFVKNGKTVATTQGRWIEKSQVPAYDSVTTEKSSDNHDRLVEIDFHNQKQVLQIGNVHNASGL